ncbi:MAG: NAD(P)H-hydrate dehydratase [Clostridiales Family XIII bacterium]|jgi:NAD(P)H-hydrate epimerase|nr:NAD(P)H-hydrate dehydratase [Clostridiales Family XIII bacterium]
METITKKYVKYLLKRRDRRSSKGDFGRLLIVAGSPGMVGAAALCATGALRGGAGLVSVSVDESLFSIVQTCVPCAVCVKRSEAAKLLTFREEDASVRSGKGDAMSHAAPLYEAAVIGPGIGMSSDARETTEAILGAYTGILVIDADALNLVAASGLNVRDSRASAILTPHEGEAARLLGTERDRVRSDREGAARALAERFGATTILKGSDTLVASPGGDIYVNPTGNPGMATGGSGDVLSGVVAAFAGQGLSAQDAARAGAYVHGLAGDMRAREIGEYGLIASDIADALPRAILSVQQSRR